MKQEQENTTTIKELIANHNQIETLKRELDELKKQKEELEARVMQNMDSDSIDVLGYNVSIKTKRTYTNWPGDIVEKEKELKELKAKSKRVGNVEYEIIKYIKVKEVN